MMRALTRWLLLLLLILAAPARAQDTPQLYVTARAPAQAQTGATLQLQLDVMTTTWFTQPPQLPTLEVNGLMVTPPSGQAELIRDTRDGVPLNGLRYTFLLSAAAPGTIAIPALSVSAQLGPSGAAATAASAPLQIEFAGQAQPGEVAGALTITQDYTLAPDPLVQGGRITRSITQRADGVQAMLLQPAPLDEVPNFKRYPREPEVTTLTDGRGRFKGGQRIDRADYVAREPGHYALPPITLHWTDGASGEPRAQTLPGREVEVAAAPAAAVPFSLADDLAQLRHGLRWALPAGAMQALLAAAVAALALWLGWPWWRRLARALRAGLRRAQARWRASEPYYWRAWRREARGAEPGLSACYRWLRRIRGAVGLRGALARMSPADRSLAENALRQAYGAGAGHAGWRGQLASASRGWRKAWRRRAPDRHALPAELNSVQPRRATRMGRQ